MRDDKHPHGREADRPDRGEAMGLPVKSRLCPIAFRPPIAAFSEKQAIRQAIGPDLRSLTARPHWQSEVIQELTERVRFSPILCS